MIRLIILKLVVVIDVFVEVDREKAQVVFYVERCVGRPEIQHLDGWDEIVSRYCVGSVIVGVANVGGCELLIAIEVDEDF